MSDRDPGLRVACFLAAAVPAQLRAEGVAVDTCVCHTEVCCRAGRALGADVRPQAVRLMVYNPALTRWVVAHQRPPTKEDQLAIPGSWSLGVGFPTAAEPGRWPGHLVAVVRGGRRPLIVDPTLAQVNRPRHGIVLAAGVVPVPSLAAWRAGATAVAAERAGCLLVYQADDRQDYRDERDWAIPRRALLSDVEWRRRFDASHQKGCTP